ncbi:hypothetical protein LTR56_005628 [Elasticomyces elasticus]|nr:hypothetical protein LTR56_005628 [Elasticomyces elasticus]KAK3663985.1 hypothetical protein LTR22_005205 [Elasticomyces elasticus]KAK4927369.1 hypothetical protein LTR49_005774 [Elasticomyces elasticus]KAK5763334.1 hypothetical protein LTS12_006509 [Elasticomyces elasticus]
MIAPHVDLLRELSAELRLEIYRLVLTTNGKLAPFDHEFGPLPFYRREPKPLWLPYRGPGIAALLAVSRYIYEEAVDILYGENVFEFSLNEIRDFENSDNFCKIKHIRLFEEAAVWKPCVVARSFIAKVRIHQALSAHKNLALQTVVIPTFTIEEYVIKSLRNFRHPILYDEAWPPEQAQAIDVDIGLWTLDLDQTYTVQLEDYLMRKWWGPIIKSSARGSSGMDILECNEIEPVKQIEERLTANSWCANPDDPEVYVGLNAVVLDAKRGVGFVDARWYRPPCYKFDGVHSLTNPLNSWQIERLDKVVKADGETEGPARLVDVNAECSKGCLAWANDVLLGARKVMCD